MVYYHVTYAPLAFGSSTSYANSKVFGKPIGLWYAEGDAWIEVLNKMEADDDAFRNKHRLPRIARGTRLKYEFPLKDEMFIDDIKNPRLDKIFKLTVGNIDAFGVEFQAYFESKLSEIQRQIKKYNDRIAARATEMNKLKVSRDPIIMKQPFLPVIISLLKEAENSKTPYISERMKPTEFLRAIKDDLYKMITGEKSRENSPLFDNLIFIHYGYFFQEVMKPKWGGIHFDASLFTPDLKAKYSFIEKVEIPSGCLWHPREVMPGYVPTPVQGGKRTRRNKFRKSTRRRRQ